MTSKSDHQTLMLRKIKFEDLATRVKWLNNPKVYQGINIDIPVKMDNTIKWFERNKRKNNRADLIIEANNLKISMIGVTESDGHTAEGYTFVNPILLGRGYGKASNFLKLVYAFKIMKIKKYKTTINSDNIPSRRMMESMGGKLIKEIKKDLYKHGKYYDRCYYECSIEDFNFEYQPYSINEDRTIILKHNKSCKNF